MEIAVDSDVTSCVARSLRRERNIEIEINRLLNVLTLNMELSIKIILIRYST